MPLGLPGRTERVTTESVMIPLVGPLFQSSATLPASTSESMSGSSERSTKSAGCPASTARRWSPDEPNEVENSTPSPPPVSWKAGMMPSSKACWGVE